jgi:16S rRNA processing protein RimM
MKKTDTDYIIIGKFGSTYGVHGWIRVRAYTELGANILEYLPWYINRKNSFTPVEVESGRMHGNTVLAKLTGVNSPEEARLLTGLSIAIPRSQLPELKENEYYWSDLIGLAVINQNGERLGEVIYLMETGSNDVLVIKGEKEHAIPYLMGTVITRIDLEKKEIHVNWELQ